MEATLVRDATGRALLLEADPNVVNTLLAVLRAPLGAVLQAARAGAGTNGEAGVGPAALGNLAASTSELREAVFARPKKDVVPEVLDLTALFQGSPPEPAECIICMKSYGAKHGTSGCQQRTAGKCGQCGEPASQVCANYKVGACCRSAYFHGNVNSWYHCVRCVHNGAEGTTEPALNCAKCGQRRRACSSCHFCDGCAARDAGFRVDGPSEGRQNDCKEAVRFLVTNALDVFESSTVQAFKVLTSAGIMSLEGLQYERVDVTPAVATTLLGNALFYSSQILERTFPTTPVDAHEVGSQPTEGSFDVIPAVSNASEPRSRERSITM